MFYQQPYWDYYAHYADYARRLCWLITRGRHECAIGLYYPIESVQADFIPTREHCNLHTFELPGTWMTPSYQWEGTSMERTDAHFRAAGNMLREAGLDYDVVDDDSLREAAVEDGELVVRGTQRYRAFLLPRTEWIPLEAYRRIAELHKAGGAVVATGGLPRFACEGASKDHEVRSLTREIFGMTPEEAGVRIDGGASAAGSGVSAPIFERPGPEVASVLRSRGVWDFESDRKGLYAQHRRIGSAELYFVAHHEREHAAEARVRLKGRGVPVILDPLDGRVYRPARWERDDGCIVLDHLFQPNEAFFVLIDEEPNLPEAGGVRPDAGSLSVAAALNGPWTLTLDRGDTHPMRMRDMPEHPRFEELAAERTVTALEPWEEIGLEGFSGGGTYEADLEWDGRVPGLQASAGQALFLDLGEVGVAAEVFVNDTSCGVRLWKPYLYRISDALRKGANRLRIRVANTLANAIRETYGTGKTPTSATREQVERFARFAEGELVSGLLGPVRILADSRSRRRS